MMRETIFGVIGTGMISGMFCDAVAGVPGARVGAILSRKIETGMDFVTKRSGDGQNAPEVYDDEMSFLSSGINAVYVACPNRFHKEHSIAAMEAGLDVLCEKPIASSRSEFLEMAKVSEATGRVLLEAMRPAFDPCYDAVRDALLRIGKIRRASFEYNQYSSRYDRFKSGEVPRAFDPSYSNAAVMDIGVYPIYVCVMLFGEPSVDISSRSIVFENGMEGSGEIILPYGYMTATVSYSKICDSVNPSVITGEKGSITIDKLSSPSVIKLIPRGGNEETLWTSAIDNNMNFEIEKFIELVSKGETDHRYCGYSRLSMGIIDRVREQNGIVFR